MPFEKHEPTESIHRPSDRLDTASIAASSWNQNDLRSLSASIKNSLPSEFGNFQLIQNLDAQTVSLSDISKNDPNYRQQAKYYFAEQAKKCELLADEKKEQPKPENASAVVEPSPEPKPPSDAQQKPIENSPATTDQTKASGPVLIAKVDATLDRNTGKLTITEMDGNAKHKKGEKLTVDAQSGNGECSIPHGQGADGRYDNATNPDRFQKAIT